MLEGGGGVDEGTVEDTAFEDCGRDNDDRPAAATNGGGTDKAG